MTRGFWENVPKPIFALAPMADVTDAAFRHLIAKYGKPDVMWTEFVSADGLMLGGEKAQKALLRDFIYSEEERPIVAQLFTAHPDVMEKAAELVSELGFDGLDINMGCPDRSIEKQGAGAALIKTPELAVEIIEAAKRGAGELPVSVKTRIGYNKNELESWIGALLKTKLAALTIHARTRKEMSKVPAHWEEVKRVVAMRNETEPGTLIIGNGGVMNLEEGRERIQETGCDGVMLGKAIFGNPWCFNTNVDVKDISINERLRIMVEHTKLFEELLPEKNFAIMKKHYKAYVHGWDGAKELRIKLMETQNALQVEELTKEYVEHIKD